MTTPLVPYTHDFTQAPISLRVEPGRVLINMQPAGSHPITALFELDALEKLLRACIDATITKGQEGT